MISKISERSNFEATSHRVSASSAVTYLNDLSYFVSRIFLDQRKLHFWPPSPLMLSLKGWETTRSPCSPTGGSQRAKETLGSQISEEN